MYRNNTRTMMDLLTYYSCYNNRKTKFNLKKEKRRDTKIYLNPDINRNTTAFIMGYLKGGLNRKVRNIIKRIDGNKGSIRVMPNDYDYLYFVDETEDVPTDYSVYNAIKFKMSFYTEPVDMDNDIVNTYYLRARNTMGSIEEYNNNSCLLNISTTKNSIIFDNIKGVK